MASFDAKGIVHYAPDAQLAGAPGGAGQLSKWRVAELPVSTITGSGYQKVVTRFQLSPNGAQQTAITKSTDRHRASSFRWCDPGNAVRAIGRLLSEFGLPRRMESEPEQDDDPPDVRLRRHPQHQLARCGGSGQGGWAPSGILVGAGYRPFLKPDGTWDQTGIIRFWRPSDGVLLKRYDSGLDIGVTSNVTFTTNSAKFAVGLYNGTTVAARS